MKPRRIEWLLFGLALFLSSQTKVERAQVFTGFQWEPGEVVEIQAERMELALRENSARFLGNVIIKKGGSVIYCQELELKYDQEGQITWLKAYQSVKLKEKDSFASGQELEYKKSANKFWLRGEPRLVSEGRIILGKEMIFDLKTSQLEVISPEIQFQRQK